MSQTKKLSTGTLQSPSRFSQSVGKSSSAWRTRWRRVPSHSQCRTVRWYSAPTLASGKYERNALAFAASPFGSIVFEVAAHGCCVAGEWCGFAWDRQQFGGALDIDQPAL